MVTQCHERGYPLPDEIYRESQAAVDDSGFESYAGYVCEGVECLGVLLG